MTTRTQTRTYTYTTLESPIGRLVLRGDGEALAGIHIEGGRRPIRLPDSWEEADAPFAAARDQLAEYFAGERTAFDLPLASVGSDFELRVWRALREIPYGETLSYGELAGRIGRPGAARAVGMANGRNPLPILVPCHRVIGADGALTGYSGGMERKRYLLDLERGALPLVA